MEQEFKHITPVQIRINDIDVLGHVNNNAYFAYYDLGKENYIKDVLGVDFATGKVLPVIANINATFVEPIFYGDDLQVLTRVSHLGTKSFTLEQMAVSKKTGHTMCSCTTVMVCVDMETKRSVPLPDIYRKAIEAYEPALKEE